jgi:pyruvate formate lyase activating enzyme
MKKISEKSIIDFIKEKNKNQRWIDAIVICGGEPTIHKELLSFLIKIKEHTGVLIKIDTNGTNPHLLKTAIRLGIVDYIAMDVKSDLILRQSKLHEEYLKSIDIVKTANDYEFRLTCVPGFVNEENIDMIMKPFYGSKILYLQQFHNDSKMIDKIMKEVEPFQLEQLIKWQKKFNKCFNKIVIRE